MLRGNHCTAELLTLLKAEKNRIIEL